MAQKELQARIAQKHDTTAHWEQNGSFVGIAGELIIYDDKYINGNTSVPAMKICDGVTPISQLPFVCDIKADIDSPALTGTPTAPTPEATDKSTKIATTEYVQNAVAAATGADLSAYQEKLTAGYGIEISDDGIISLTQEGAEGDFNEEVQKAIMQCFEALGDKDPTMKPYTSKLRSSILNMEEFAKLGSGLFIHWGVYSVPAGHYDGEKVATSTVGTKTDINYNVEWSLRDLGIPLDVYKAYENQFTGENFDPNAICQMAVNLGMKYIIITAKHHEGFCLVPTENNTGWDIRTAACRNTIMDELKAACDRHKLKLCFYYSHYWDWMNEGGFGLNHGNKWTTTDPYTTAQHVAYCNKAIAQINELIQKYSPYILWYDPGTNVGTTYRDMFRSAEKQYYPNIITNDRLGYNREYGDYGTGERTIYLRTLPYGESCFTLNNTWGYSVNNETESSYYSLETVLKQFMLYTISYGQNCVLNVGPKPDGSLPALTTSRLGALKTFIDTYFPGGFYDYKRINTKCRPKWGYMIGKGNKITCFVVMPGNKNYSDVLLDGVDTTLLKTDGVHILTPGTNPSYQILDDCCIQIHGLALDSTSKIGVVELEYETAPLLVDATTARNHELITSRVFPVKTTSYDFSSCTHKFNESATMNLSTELIWMDEDKHASIVLNYTPPATGAGGVTTTIVVTDAEDEDKTQTFTYQPLEYAIETKFTFEEGHRYKIDFSCSGSVASKMEFKGFTIEYNDVESVTGVTVTPTTATLAVGGYTQLTANVTPAYADDTSVTWATSNASVATVSSGGFVTAVGLGNAVITVTTNDGGHQASCNVSVQDIAVEGISFESDAISMYECETRELKYTITPANAGDQAVTWATSDASIVAINDGIATVQPNVTGSATITVTTNDGNHSATCTITAVPETYSYIFQADSLDGSAEQGEDKTDILLFSDDYQNWTLVGYVANSVNPNADNNATLYQCVVSASPWTGLRVDADNNNYPSATSARSPMIPRFLAGADRYINPTTGAQVSGKPNINPTALMHPVCFSRNGNTYKSSIDGVNWTEFENLTTAQLTRLKPEWLTVGFDYKRAGGQKTTTKYRFLKTDSPCVVAIHDESEYPFWKIYNTYDASRPLGTVVEKN